MPKSSTPKSVKTGSKAAPRAASNEKPAASTPSGCWLVKQEASAYSWDDFVRDGGTSWTGVRNFQARNHLRAMRAGDRVFYYHSVEEKRLVGVAEVKRTAYPDPTAKEGDWSCVDLVPKSPLARPVTLEEIKRVPEFSQLVLLKNSRLSVQPISRADFERLLAISNT